MIEVIEKDGEFFKVYTYSYKTSKTVKCGKDGKPLSRRERKDKGKSRPKKYKTRNDIGKKHNVLKTRKDKGKVRFMYGGKLTKKCMPTVINSKDTFENLYPQIILSN